MSLDTMSLGFVRHLCIHPKTVSHHRIYIANWPHTTPSRDALTALRVYSP